MTLYMPPLQKKKRVPNRYNPDTFRVISCDAEGAHPKYSPKPDYRPPTPERERTGISLPDIYNRRTQVLPKDQPDYRINKPHPGSCGFLRHNVRVLNEPICRVFTSDTHTEQNLWWPSRTSSDPLNLPPKTKDTTYRGDYMKDEYGQLHRTTRHEANTNRDPALGTVPVNFLRNRDGSQRVFKETKSYEHDYNSRSATNYPIRGRRVGSFVYDEYDPVTTKKFIDQHSRLLDEDAAYRKQQESQSSKSSSSSPSGAGSSSTSSSSQSLPSPCKAPSSMSKETPITQSVQKSGQGDAPAAEGSKYNTPAPAAANGGAPPAVTNGGAPPATEVKTSSPVKENTTTNNTKTVTFDVTKNEQ